MIAANTNLCRPHVALTHQLIGQPGSRARIPTPAAILDLDAFERNLQRMASHAHSAGLALRPHVKSHKSTKLARMQIASGAVGICCAKLAEAEAMAAGGLDSILLTSPIAGGPSATRAAWLADDIRDFRVVLDDIEGVAELAAAARGEIRVLIDVDVGQARTGVAGPEQALELARAIAICPKLTLIGVQGYGGHWQHIQDPAARAAAVAEGMRCLQDVVSALREWGAVIEVVTGGGTGTHVIDAARGVLSEIQPGSYPFMDREYRDALSNDAPHGLEQSLFVAATVISANQPNWVTVDAGLKAFATDGPMPAVATAEFEDCAYFFFGDEHGMVTRPSSGAIARGDRIEFTPGHIDPTLDRYNCIHLVRGDTLVDIAPIEGRGASQ